MAMFLLPKFEIHSLEKKRPWTLLTLSLSSADWPLARCPWPMATDPWAINPEPWALGSSQGPRALCSTDQDDAIMSKSHGLMDNHLLSWTLSLALIPEPWSWSMTPDPCPKSCNHTKIEWIHVIIMYFQRKIIEWMENCLTQYKKHWFSMWHHRKIITTQHGIGICSMKNM